VKMTHMLSLSLLLVLLLAIAGTVESSDVKGSAHHQPAAHQPAAHQPAAHQPAARQPAQSTSAAASHQPHEDPEALDESAEYELDMIQQWFVGLHAKEQDAVTDMVAMLEEGMVAKMEQMERDSAQCEKMSPGSKACLDAQQGLDALEEAVSVLEAFMAELQSQSKDQTPSPAVVDDECAKFLAKGKEIMAMLGLGMPGALSGSGSSQPRSGHPQGGSHSPRAGETRRKSKAAGDGGKTKAKPK